MRTTRINDNLVLNEYKDGLLFGTDALLVSKFVVGGSRKKVVDLGSGSGVIGLLLLSEKKAGHVFGVEIQEKYAKLSELNAIENQFEDKYTAINCDLKDIKNHFVSGNADIVVSNPPYMKSNYGKKNISEEKSIARHEIFCNIDDICKAASWCLKSGGDFFLVHRPERLSAIFASMKKYSIEPKKLLPVASSYDSFPSLILISGKKDASEGLLYYPTLCLFENVDGKRIPVSNDTLNNLINRTK